MRAATSSRTLIRTATALGALLALASTTALPLAPARAQGFNPEGTGGLQLTTGVALRYETDSNRALDPDDPGRTNEALIRLSAGLLSETRSARFAFDLAGDLRRLDTPSLFGDVETKFENPSAALSYERGSANASFGVFATLREADLADNSLILEEDVLTGLPIIDVVTGTAKRRDTSLRTRLSYGDSGPFGMTLSAEAEETTYRDGLALELGGRVLNDTRSNRVALDFRFDLDPTRQITLGLGRRLFEEENSEEGLRETLDADLSFSLERPVGRFTAIIGATDTEDGTRSFVSARQVLDRPLGQLSFGLGLTRTAAGDTVATGDLGLRRDLPRGQLTLALSRGVENAAATDEERLTTQINLGYTQALTPLSSLSLVGNWSSVEETEFDGTIDTTRLGATYNQQLTPDWSLQMGYEHRIRTNTVEEDASSDRVFFQLSRSFVARF